MAGNAGQVHVSAGQRESGRRVIKGCIRPRGCTVTNGAICRESRRHVVRVCGGLIIPQMARATIARRPGVLPVRVAQRASDRNVSARQWERRVAVVIELGHIIPDDGVMAETAVLREIGLSMIRVGGSRKIFGVTIDTTCAGQAIVAANVAGGAICLCVRAG